MFLYLIRLSGRLDLVLNQIKRNTDDDPIFNHDNVLVFEDDEVSDDGIKNDDENSTDEDDFEMINGDNSEKLNGEISSTADEEDSDDEMASD